MSFDASEIRALSVDLGLVSANVKRQTRTIVRKTAKDIERTAKSLAPVDTGNLKGSIGTSDLRSMGTSGSIEAEVRATANYAIYQELGTSRMPAQPSMGPATDKHSPAFEESMADLLRNML